MGRLDRSPRRSHSRVTDAPIGASVVRTEEFDHDIRSSLGPEQSPDGTRPSREDFEHLYWPMLAAELAFAQSVECITATSIGAGHGPILDPNVPEGRFTAVAVGAGHSCALRLDGSPVCWGNTYTPMKPYYRHEPDPNSRFTSISSGGSHVCGVRTDGAIECWGLPGFIAY